MKCIQFQTKFELKFFYQKMPQMYEKQENAQEVKNKNHLKTSCGKIQF